MDVQKKRLHVKTEIFGLCSSFWAPNKKYLIFVIYDQQQVDMQI